MTQRGGKQPAKYQQIAADLRARIEDGEWAVDERMPPLPELADRYKVVQTTIDKALGVLRDLGMAETIHGIGTFVRKPPPSAEDLTKQVILLTERVGALEERVTQLEADRDSSR